MRLIESRVLRILDFDLENRPLSYWVPDRPTAEVTAVASCWIERDKYGEFVFGSMQVDLLGEMSLEDILTRFAVRYAEADMVTGHYIRRHDLPILNAMHYELGLPLLAPKLTCDTKLDMFKKADLPATQEFLLETLEIKGEKFHMSQKSWRDANRLTPSGLDLTRRRVSSDVRSHILMRDEMLRRGMLRSPRVWDPGGARADVADFRH